MKKRFYVPNNKTKQEYQSMADDKAKEWRSYKQPNDGDFIIFDRICNGDLVWVFYNNKLHSINSEFQF